jgi:exodeoxyribonuclease V alpha subunit
MPETIQGQVERVTFTNREDGYSVVKLKAPGHRDLVVAVGNFAAVTPGEILRMEGRWTVHSRYGEQFLVNRYESVIPANVEGIRKYLGSGLIRGIGPVMADRIARHFGEDTLTVIDEQPQRLREIDGIGRYRVEQIRAAWEEQKEIREVMVFLRGHEVSAAYATRIFKHYGKESLRVVGDNPYRLAMDVSGIGFLTADKIARNLGFAVDSPLRAEAGLLYALHQASEEGHLCTPHGWLLERASALLGIPHGVLDEAIERLRTNQRILVEVIPPEIRDDFGDDRAVYLRGYHIAESQTARRLLRLQAARPLQRGWDAEKGLLQLQQRLSLRLAPLQAEAVKRAMTEKVLVVTGGPGTGKTTLIRAILLLYRELGGCVVLAAPTGRAAKRLSEATGHAASTLHRLLEFSPQTGGFQRDEQKPLNADLVVVDEASMVDGVLMHHLLKAVPPAATLVLVGDVDQLPPVGPGSVLHDVIACGRFTVVRLTEIFRQARRSQIVVNAHLVQQGKFPQLAASGEGAGDFFFIEKEDPEHVLQVVLKLCSERIPRKFGLDPLAGIQVLSPMHRGRVGAHALNTALQRTLNPHGAAMERGGQEFRAGDKVMQIRNNYEKEVFNGDIGRIRRIDHDNQRVMVELDGRLVPYEFSELDELVPAYAITVHKAQGSEYPAVVLPLLTQHFVMLQRNLLYTAITRGKKLVVIVGSKKAVAMAVKNNRTQRRFTLLKERLQGAWASP